MIVAHLMGNGFARILDRTSTTPQRKGREELAFGSSDSPELGIAALKAIIGQLTNCVKQLERVDELSSVSKVLW